MKKIISTCMLLLFVFCITGCTEKEISISEYDEYIGTWTLSGEAEYEDLKVTDSYFKFNKDGSCYFSFTLGGNYSSIGIEGTSDGTCYLNSSKDKFKMEGYGSIFEEWTDFSDKEDYIIINKWKYTKK